MSLSERVNVLVISVSQQKSQELEAVLKDLEQNVVCASNSHEALRLLRQDDFAVVLLDVNHAEIDGVELATRIRRRRRCENTPILFLTGSNGAVDAARMSAVSLSDRVSAPIDPQEIQAKVATYAKLYRKTESMSQQVAHRIQLAREQAARQVAETAMRRSALLADASRDLSRSLDFEDTLQSLRRALVPAFADACQLILCDTDGICWYAPMGKESRPIRGGVLGSRTRVQTVNTQLASAVGQAIDSGHAAEIPSEIVRQAPAIQRKQDWPNVLIAPLIARDIPLGAIICCRRGTRRRFGLAEVALVEDLAGRAATALDNAQLFQTIREGERRKDEFLAMLGHELRNPLAAITNAGELTRLLDSSERAFQETLEVIRQQAALMKRLVDDLLDVSRITSGRIQLQKATVCAGDIVARVAESNGPLFVARNHVLHLSLSKERILFEADLCRLEQILSNLLVNAAKYTDPGGEIWFSVAREQDEVVFRVKDSGMGIGPDLLPIVFDLFAQANRSLHRSEGGLGIGLTIVKGLTDLHGGRVSVASDGITRGSEFAIYLPIAPKLPAVVSVPAPAAPISVLRRRRVLVVEDQPALLRVTVALLKKFGHDVEAAADGNEAILAVREHQPEIVFLDIGLPGMDGYEVARHLRAEMGDGAPVLVAMTGYGKHEVDRHVGKGRFDRHLVKPADVSALQQLFAEIE